MVKRNEKKKKSIFNTYDDANNYFEHLFTYSELTYSTFNKREKITTLKQFVNKRPS